MLTIPSISSGVFGSGDAKAACIEKNSGSVVSFAFTNDMAALPSFCDKDPSTSLCNKPDGFMFNGSTACSSSGGSCEAELNISIRCSHLDVSQCRSAEGDIGIYCKWVAEDVNNNKLVDAVCRVYQIATGTAGKAFAAVGVISVGIGFFTGKVSWGLMISVAAGIAVFFGAPSIIAVISGSDTSTLCSQVVG